MSPFDPPHLHAFVSRGPNTGTILYPHKHRDGRYAVSMTKFKNDYFYVDNSADLLGWLQKGFSLRMSNKAAGATGPRLIGPESIFRPVKL